MKKLILAISMLACGTGNAITLNPARTVEVIDVVDGSMLADVAQKINKLASVSKDPIDLLINSPGGAVLVGTTILDAMDVAKAKGVKFRCTTGVLAASMAFVILANCDERYALPGTKLLFHPMSTGGQGRLQELLVSFKQMKTVELRLINLQRNALGMEADEFIANYWAETMWEGSGLANATSGFITITTDIQGTANLFVFERPKGLFGLLKKKLGSEYKEAERIYRKFGLTLERGFNDENAE